MQSSENGASTDNGMTTNPTSALAEFAGADATSDSLPISDPEALRSDMQALFGDESADPKKVGDDTTLSDLIQ
ncbi:MAG: hypothetical protein KDJ38_01525 [Gammaproteobacteria bacterium]|nr:hypothetical protein [Gammaproteobacteria bacterium]